MKTRILAALMAGALAAGAGPLAPGASASDHMIVCPLVGGVATCCGPPVAINAHPAVIPCCPVPTTVCCAMVAGIDCCGPALCTVMTLAAIPDPAEAGQSVTVNGTVRPTAPSVTLWEQQAGQTAFAQVATAKPSASGAFQFSRPVETNVQWYATAGTAIAPTISVPVEAAIRVGASSRRLSATVVPSHAGARVAVQRRRGRRWVTIARPALDASSHFSLALHARSHRRLHLRIVLAPDARNWRSVSRTVVVS